MLAWLLDPLLGWLRIDWSGLNREPADPALDFGEACLPRTDCGCICHRWPASHMVACCDLSGQIAAP